MSIENKSKKELITYNKVLGGRIKLIRKSLGYKTFQDINIDGLNNFTYSYIERGDRDVKLSSLLAICKKFRISLSDLLNDIEGEVEKQLSIIALTDVSKK